MAYWNFRLKECNTNPEPRYASVTVLLVGMRIRDESRHVDAVPSSLANGLRVFRFFRFIFRRFRETAKSEY